MTIDGSSASAEPRTLRERSCWCLNRAAAAMALAVALFPSGNAEIVALVDALSSSNVVGRIQTTP